MQRIVLTLICFLFVFVALGQVDCSMAKDSSVNRFDSDGNLTGIWKYFDKSSCTLLWIDSMAFGKKNGWSIAFSSSGDTISKAHYVNDTLHGLVITKSFGRTQVCEFKNNQRNGFCTIYDYRGHLAESYEYKDGKLDGKGIIYNKKGFTWITFEYTNGKENGSRKVFSGKKHNKLTREFIFEDDKKVKAIFYSRSSKIKKSITY